MKKNLFFAGTCIVLCLLLGACKKTQTAAAPEARNINLVPESMARSLAGNLPADRFTVKPGAPPSANKLRVVANIITITDDHRIPVLYVANYENNGGYAVISADFKLDPIQAVIDRGNFSSLHDLPANVRDWYTDVFRQMDDVRTAKSTYAARGLSAWKLLAREIHIAVGNSPGVWGGDPCTVTQCGDIPINPPCEDPEVYSVVNVGPLLSTTWGQRCTYNDLCPLSGCGSSCTPDVAVTGAAPTAIAQVVRYWQPANAYAFSANYATMPNNAGNSDVQALMYQAGLNTSSSYGCTTTSTTSTNIVAGLNSFGLTGTYTSYSISSLSTLGSEIVANRPVILVANASGYGTHTWVCDGYFHSYTSCAEYVYLHMNWGMETANAANSYNGWYFGHTWSVAGYTFNSSKKMIYNIHL